MKRQGSKTVGIGFGIILNVPWFGDIKAKHELEGGRFPLANLTSFRRSLSELSTVWAYGFTNAWFAPYKNMLLTKH